MNSERSGTLYHWIVVTGVVTCRSSSYLCHLFFVVIDFIYFIFDLLI